ncbi:hypothetical protein OAF98_01790 [Planctomicrobium sp.]|nr:hypothetical protein [Planctomicrobium sp.]MDA7503394.1 hypothetical protein [bacterium]MDB4439340.1 hypothetical protein [Planctomicrobium sp.]MDB4733124.1 hypothetical protein [Planctomicrobium sp.]MDB4743192.1 hypothetical protein [Planctomicrobium sp.]
MSDVLDETGDILVVYLILREMASQLLVNDDSAGDRQSQPS